MVERVRGFLVRLLVVGMVPLLAVLTPETARAATTYGDPAVTQFGDNQNKFGAATGGAWGCNVTGYWQAIETVMNVKGEVVCSTGYGVSSMPVGFTARGAGCSGTWDPIEMDGVGTRDFMIPMGAVVGSCQVTELCADVTIKWHTNPWMDNHWDECVPWAVGGPESSGPPGGSCDGITMSAPVASAPFIAEVDSSGNLAYVIDTTFEVTADETVAAQDVQIYVTTSNNSVHDPSSTMKTATAGSRKGRTATISIAPGTTTTGTVRVGVSYKDDTNPDPPSRTVTASGYWFGPTGGGWANYVGSAQSGSSLGLTRSSPYCTAHWGEKLALTEGDDYDEPIGPQIDSESVPSTGGSATEPDSTPDEPVSDDTCGGFSLTDPASWAGAGVCAIVKAIGALVDVVTGLVPAIGDLLAALFMPHPSTWGVEEFLDTVGERPPFSLGTGMADSFESMADGWAASSGCGGDVIDIEVEGVDASVTCSAVKNIDGMAGLYALAQAAIWGSAVWGIWNMLQTAIERSAS